MIRITAFLAASACALALTPEQLAKLPPPAANTVDFTKDIQPLLEAACVKCHAKGKEKGGFSLETRDRFLKGGETGAAAIVGKSAESLIVELVAGLDPDAVMPKKGSRWTPAQVGLLRAWIDQGAPWPEGVTFAKPAPHNLAPRAVALAARPGVHPVDDLAGRAFAERGIEWPRAVDDRTFARRAYLDTVGLLPLPAHIDAFASDPAPDKRAKLVAALLADRRGYADHWLTFWNDLLRNDYKGVGFIDGGRRQITGWLYSALVENKPYDAFVRELVNPSPASEGFTRGIIWRGDVPAAMRPPLQAAQNVSQVFMGINLKCASCHDSFINDWALADAYGMAAIYADDALELIHCDKPTGKKAAVRFLYPELGAIDAAAKKDERLARAAEIITAKTNGRLARTIVNRLWARLMGRGLVEPIDDMDLPAWSPELLDWLAEDFVAHGHDVKHTIARIMTSTAYALPSVEAAGEKEAFIFRGPLTRRLTAEQFSDAVSTLTGDWARMPDSMEFDFLRGGVAEGVTMPQWLWTSEPPHLGAQRAAMREARPAVEAATQRFAEAEKEGGEKIKAAADALAAAQEKVRAAAAVAARAPGEAIPESDRHWVIFRREIEMAGAFDEAHATLLATQNAELWVNGKQLKATRRDGTRNSRVALFDLRPALVAGKNAIAIAVSSHTEKSMNDAERAANPASRTHLNSQAGVAFYLRAERAGAKPLEITTDAAWRTRRDLEGAWNAAGFADAHWAKAAPLPQGASPVDEGPGLPPVTRKDFANQPVPLGPALTGAVSNVLSIGEVRAALRASDPLQAALDRPNREIVVPARATAATTIQALELTNGATLNARLKTTAEKLARDAAKDPAAWLEATYARALARPPAAAERQLALDFLGPEPKPEAAADFLWSLLMLPEFQLIR